MKVLHYRQRLDELGAAVLFVAYDDPELLRRTMISDLELPYPLLVDRSRAAYAAWGLRRAGLLRIWGDPRVWLDYARLILHGERIRGRGLDTLQLGGDFVVDPAGTIVYSRPQTRDDRPPVAHLIRAIEDI